MASEAFPTSKTTMTLDDFAQFAKRGKAKKMTKSKSKNEAMYPLQGTSQTASVNAVQTENPPEGIIMFSKMVCQWCNGIPFPNKRFSCPAGHTFCAVCGEERFLKHGAKCMIEIMDEDAGQVDLDVGSSSQTAALMIPIPRIITPYYMMNEFPTVHFPVCQQQITLQPEDPIYTEMWNHAKWMCPGGCNQVFEGHSMAKHLLQCEEQKKKSELKKASENKPKEELPSSSSSLKGDLAEDRNKMVMSNQPELIVCNLNGCSMQMPVKEVGRHITLEHQVYAMDAGNDDRYGNIAGLLYIPLVEIKAKRPFYTLIRRCRRSFLFCMEHSSEKCNYVVFWIRRISNMENTEDDNGPYFKYNLHMRNGNMQVAYKGGCIPWRKSTGETLSDKKCLKLPSSMVLNELVFTCVNKNCTDQKSEVGFLVVNFVIMIGNAVGELYRDETAEDVTSSMESLVTTTAATAVYSPDQRPSDEIEAVQESGNDNNDGGDDAEMEEEEAINDDEVVGDDGEKEDEEKAVNDDDGDVVDDDEQKEEEKAATVENVADDDEEMEDKKVEPLPLVVNANEEKPDKMKIWIDKMYAKGEKFSPKYAP